MSFTRVSTRSQQQTTTTTMTVVQHLSVREEENHSTTSGSSTSQQRRQSRQQSALADLFDCVYALSESLFNNSVKNTSNRSISNVSSEERRQFKQVLDAAKSLALEIEPKFNDDVDDEQIDEYLPEILQSTVDQYSHSLRLLSNTLQVDNQKRSRYSNGLGAAAQPIKHSARKRTRDTSTKIIDEKLATDYSSGERKDEPVGSTSTNAAVVRKKRQTAGDRSTTRVISATTAPISSVTNNSTNRQIADDNDEDNNDMQPTIDDIMQRFVDAQPTPTEQLLNQFVEKYQLCNAQWLSPQQSNCSAALRILQSMGSEFLISQSDEQLTMFLDDATNLLLQNDQTARTKRFVDFLNEVRSTENLQCAIQQLKLCHLATKAIKHNNNHLAAAATNNSSTSSTTAAIRNNTANVDEITMHQRMFEWDRAEAQYRNSKQQRWTTFVRFAISVAEFVRDNYSQKRNFLDLTLESLNRARTAEQRPLSYDVVKELHALGNSLLQSDVLRQCMQDNHSIGNRRAWQKANRGEAFQLARPMIEYLLENDYRWYDVQ
jgi:hypothetical protein